MLIAFYLLTALLAATPILAIADGSFAYQVIALACAGTLAAAATGPQTDITAAAQLLRRLSLAMIFPLLWMVLQIVPLPFASIVNPIWSTTAIALNDPSLNGRISIDPGATFRSLIWYLTILSLIASTVIITKDRHRAQTILLVLNVVTTFMSAEVLLSQLASFAGIIPSTSAATTFAAVAALGALINGAIIVLVIERHLTQQNSGFWLPLPVLAKVSLSLCGIAIALAAMRVLAQGSLFAATGLGFSVIPLIIVVRRLRFRPWTAAIVIATLLAVAMAIAEQHFQSGSSSGLLAFVTSAAPDSLTISQRALSDSPWMGSGVGTFKFLSRIYQDFGGEIAPVAASAAVSIAIEWGTPALLILAGIAVQLLFFTLRGAVRRGRDSFFSSAAAATLVVVFCEGFLDSSLLNPAVQIIVAAAIGLGISQSTGRTTGLED